MLLRTGPLHRPPACYLDRAARVVVRRAEVPAWRSDQAYSADSAPINALAAGSKQDVTVVFTASCEACMHSMHQESMTGHAFSRASLSW